MRRTLLVAAVGLTATMGFAAPAMAQTPGTNGTLVYSYGSQDEDTTDAFGVPCGDSVYDGDSDVVDGSSVVVWAQVAPDGKSALVELYYYSGDSDSYQNNTFRVAVSGSGCAPAVEFNTSVQNDVDAVTESHYSPDGEMVALDMDDDVYEVNATTGATIRDLTPNLPRTIESDGVFSPNGKTVAYIASDGIRSRPVGGGSSKLLYKDSTVFSSLDYSPDGTKILFVKGGYIQYVTLSTGKVTKTAIKAGMASWSPDGKDVVFSTGSEVATATIGGKILTRVNSNDDYTAYQWRKK